MQMDSIGLLGNMFAVAKNLCRGALSLLAESYCHRRNTQVQEMLLSLEGDTVDYSGVELEAIAQQLSMQ